MQYMGPSIGWQLAATLVLAMACSGDRLSLGNDNEAATGGSPGETGGTSTIGGNPGATGGISATGGAGETGGAPNTAAYVLDPTLPLDPSCTCDTSDKICNTARECVPRCDEAGHCARWLANRAVADMFVEGNTLFFALGAGQDPVGNPGTNGALYRVDATADSPVLVAANLGSPARILGRYKGVTVIQTVVASSGGTIILVHDSGEIFTLGQCGSAAAMWGHWIVSTDVMSNKLNGIDLDSTLQPRVLFDVSSVQGALSDLVVLDDFVSFNKSDANSGTFSRCLLQLSNPASEACVAGVDSCWYMAVSKAGDEFFCSYHFWVSAYSRFNARLLELYNVNEEPPGYYPGRVAESDGWLYMVLYESTDDWTGRLARVPTHTGRLPQDVVPPAIATRHNRVNVTGMSDSTVFAVGSSQFYWVQYVDPTYDGPQYIFSAPLPPQPCDPELPCTNASLTCKDGFCTPV